MISRRTLAFEANIARVLLRKCCLFTFTFRDVLNPREASARWTRFLKQVRRYESKWSGVRVFELHPGRWNQFSHGLHIHVVSHVFFSDRVMLGLCKAYGLGRFERKRIKDKEAAYYIGKYLDKKRPGAFKGMRLQSSFGPHPWTRLRHIVIDSLRTRCFRAAARQQWRDGRNWERRSWMEKLALVSQLQMQVMVLGLQWDPERQLYWLPTYSRPRSPRRPLEQIELIDVPETRSPLRFTRGVDSFDLTFA